jgi:Family of unknown function (DUF6056)
MGNFLIDTMTKYQKKISLIVVFSFVLFENIMTPMWGDDYCRTGKLNLLDAFSYAWRDYFSWTGRFFVTVITYWTMQIGWAWSMLPFDIINSAVFVWLLLHVIALAGHAVERPEASRLRTIGATEIVFTALLLWWIPRDFGEVALWKTGAIGYLWAVTGELWVLRLLLERNAPYRLPAIAGTFVIATFLESISLFMSGVMLLWCIACHTRKKPTPWSLLIAHAIGTIMLLGAPGNFVRQGILPPSPPLDRLMGVIGNLGSLFDAYWLIAVVVLLLAYQAPRLWGKVKESKSGWSVLTAGNGWIFVAGALLYMLVLLGVPRSALAARVSFPASVFLVCYLVSLFLQRPVSKYNERLQLVVLGVLFGVTCLAVVSHLERLADINHTWVKNPQLKAGPQEDALLPMMEVDHHLVYARKDRFFEGLTEDPTNFRNVCFARAFGVKSVTAKP